MILSVVIPVYNESGTIGAVLSLVCAALPRVPKEIIIVDDGSRDGTREWLAANVPVSDTWNSGVRVASDRSLILLDAAAEPTGAARFQLHLHERNLGKGAAVRTGLAAATGDVVVIQDADLEYDPADWAVMWDLIATRQIADVVFGSRFYGRPHRSLLFHHFLGNKIISLVFNVLFNQTLTDVEVAYKMLRREVVDTLRLTANDFGIEVELSAQVALARRWRIYEVGISYFGRTYEEGKKINWKDGIKALWYLLKYRFWS